MCFESSCKNKKPRDAIHTIHPLIGQGFNLGIDSVQSLIDTLENAVECGYDLGEKYVLKKYERQHMKNSIPVAFSTPLMNYGFTNQNFALAALRSLGLTMFNQLDPVKVIL